MGKKHIRQMGTRGITSDESLSCCRRNWLLTALLVGFIAATLSLSGCHSAYVSATISNQRPSAISLVQIEYPSATFGTQSIAPGADFKYRFKVLGSGTVKVTYTDASGLEHKFIGPTLNEGDEGTLAVGVGEGKLNWNLHLASR